MSLMYVSIKVESVLGSMHLLLIIQELPLLNVLLIVISVCLIKTIMIKQSEGFKEIKSMQQ